MTYHIKGLELIYFDALLSHMIAITMLDDFVVEINKKNVTFVTSKNPRLTIDPYNIGTWSQSDQHA